MKQFQTELIPKEASWDQHCKHHKEAGLNLQQIHTVHTSISTDKFYAKSGQSLVSGGFFPTLPGGKRFFGAEDFFKAFDKIAWRPSCWVLRLSWNAVPI